MTDEESPEVPIVCPACDTRARVPLADVSEQVERHNDRLHDGEECARIDPDVADYIADLVAEDLDLLD